MLNLRFPLAIQGAQLAEYVILKLVLKEDRCGRFRFGSQFMICNYVKTNDRFEQHPYETVRDQLTWGSVKLV